jgi:hypothetical protein
VSDPCDLIILLKENERKTKMALIQVQCPFCDTLASVAVNSVEGNEYYNVCIADQARLIADHAMVAVDVEPSSLDDYCGCGCGY